MRLEQIPYGVKDFKRMRLENFYYVDKSQFIEKLESRANFLFFVRPRRFDGALEPIPGTCARGNVPRIPAWLKASHACPQIQAK